MKIKSKTGEELNFLETGVDGIYVLDRVAFKDKFDEIGNNDWKTSGGKFKLQEWAEKNLPQEILEQFDVDIPTVEEVFSQKMIDWWKRYSPTNGLVSKQFPIFKNSDERMMEFESKFIWWWTRSAVPDYTGFLWGVNSDGSINDDYSNNRHGFVPVLRRKPRQAKMKKIKDITIGECYDICKRFSCDCNKCPLKYACFIHPAIIIKDDVLETEVEVPEE